jgi:hypothetical protein
MEALVQQEAGLRAQMRGRRAGMKEQRVHQDHVAGRACNLDYLERDSVDIFDAFMKPGNAGSRIAGSAKIAQVGVPLQGLAELRAARARWLGMLGKPLVHQPMRSA